MEPEDDYGEDQGTGRPEPTPAMPDLAPIEQRLNRITEAVTSLSRRDQDRERATYAEKLRAYESRIHQAVKQSQSQVDQAERTLAAAHEDGDPTAIARATRAMGDAVSQRESARNDFREFERLKKQNERRDGGSTGSGGDSSAEQSASRDTTNLNDWKKQHQEWYGVDGDMTKAAHEIDRTIREAGVIAVGSREYFQAIDRQMARKYPDRFKSAPNTSGGSGAPSGGQRPSTGRIPRDVLDTWSKMGIDVSDDKTLERMVKNRETLVRKGILPEQPAYGRVI